MGNHLSVGVKGEDSDGQVGQWSGPCLLRDRPPGLLSKEHLFLDVGAPVPCCVGLCSHLSYAARSLTSAEVAALAQ